jgi:hypothetical protein
LLPLLDRRAGGEEVAHGWSDDDQDEDPEGWEPGPGRADPPPTGRRSLALGDLSGPRVRDGGDVRIRVSPAVSGGTGDLATATTAQLVPLGVRQDDPAGSWRHRAIMPDTGLHAVPDNVVRAWLLPSRGDRHVRTTVEAPDGCSAPLGRGVPL